MAARLGRHGGGWLGALSAVTVWCLTAAVAVRCGSNGAAWQSIGSMKILSYSLGLFTLDILHFYYSPFFFFFFFLDNVCLISKKVCDTVNHRNIKRTPGGHTCLCTVAAAPSYVGHFIIVFF